MTSKRARSEVVPRSFPESGNDLEGEVVPVPSAFGRVGTTGTGNDSLGGRSFRERPPGNDLPERINVRGKSGDPTRGSWCTNRLIAAAVGPWDLDPFSNDRSHIQATHSCALERGEDGFGDGTPGSYRTLSEGLLRASGETRVWGQPPYDIVLRAYRHYAHTRWAFLLRFDPRPEWFDLVYDAAELVAVIRDPEARDFEPPPGIPASGSTFPHAIYYRRASDATPELLRMCIAWRKRPTT